MDNVARNEWEASLATRREILQGIAVTAIAPTTAAPTTASAAMAETAIIAAASTLRFCLADIANAFEQTGGGKLRLVFGSSGNLSRQITMGAPFALFLSANESFVKKLVDAGRTTDSGRLYAIGRLAIITRKGGRLNVDPELRGIRAALRSGQLTRFAIANPAHAPYGKRAREALTHAALWPELTARLVLGENVAQAAQFAVTGAADAGLVASALAASPRIARLVESAIIPASWHRPLRQRMVILTGRPPAQQQQASAFYEFLQGPTARTILRKNGFGLPPA